MKKAFSNKFVIFPETVSVREMQRNYRQLLDKAKTFRVPLFILKNNSPEAVIVDIESWNEIAAKVLQREEKEALKAISVFNKERRQKRLKVLKGSLTDLVD